MPPTTPEPSAAAEILVSVDVEAAGPAPSRYSLLTIGACLVDDPERTFYVELQPLHDAAVPAALEVSGLTLEALRETGVPAEQAMRSFADWLLGLEAEGKLVFVGFNAAFDWMFVEDYFARFGIRNPFGHAALDIKAYAMGRTGSTWSATSMEKLSPLYLEGRSLSHNALDDARDQAELFRALRA